MSLRAHLQPVDTRFFGPRTPVAIVDLGATAEALLARAMLESLGAAVMLHQPGTPEDFLLVLGQSEAARRYLVLCGHGDEDGLILGDYAPGIDTSALAGGRMAPATIAARAHMPGRIVVSTACMTGTDAWGKAFLAGGACAYVAPDGYPEGADVPLFLHHLFHQLLAHNASIETAWRHAASDAAGRLFVLHTPESALRLPA